MVNRSIIGRKSSLVEDHLKRIRSLPHLSLEEFRRDIIAQDVFLFNITQAIQNCIDIAAHIVSDEEWGIPGTQSETLEILGEKLIIPKELVDKLIIMVGFRNRVVHEYEKLDLEIVYEIWQNQLRDIEKFCFAVAERFGL